MFKKLIILILISFVSILSSAQTSTKATTVKPVVKNETFCQCFTAEIGGSQPGKTYQLTMNGNNIGWCFTGDGGPIKFGTFYLGGALRLKINGVETPAVHNINLYRAKYNSEDITINSDEMINGWNADGRYVRELHMSIGADSTIITKLTILK